MQNGERLEHISGASPGPSWSESCPALLQKAGIDPLLIRAEAGAYCAHISCPQQALNDDPLADVGRSQLKSIAEPGLRI